MSYKRTYLKILFVMLGMIGIASTASAVGELSNKTSANNVFDLLGLSESGVPGQRFDVNLPFDDGHIIPDLYTCKDKETMPVISLVNVPNGTRSFAVIVQDMTAKFVHLMVADIPSNGSSSIDAASIRGASIGTNSFGHRAYSGPCPPKGKGEHTYIYGVCALKVAKLDLPKDFQLAELKRLIKHNTLGCAAVSGVYARAQ